jgi:hypothetical protein
MNVNTSGISPPIKPLHQQGSESTIINAFSGEDTFAPNGSATFSGAPGVWPNARIAKFAIRKDAARRAQFRALAASGQLHTR